METDTSFKWIQLYTKPMNSSLVVFQKKKKRIVVWFWVIGLVDLKIKTKNVCKKKKILCYIIGDF